MHTKKAEEMFCKNDHMKKEPETQVGDSGEEQPCLATTCCTDKRGFKVLMCLCGGLEEVTNCSFCLFNRQSNNNDTEP